MSALSELLRRALSDLERAGASCALIGGLAVSARTEPRFTRDVDLAVAVDGDTRAERLIHQMIEFGWIVLAQIEQDGTKRLATVRLGYPHSGEADRPVVDLLFASSGIEPEIVEESEPMEIFGAVLAPVASSHHLLALKVLAMDEHTRPLDRPDAKALLSVLDEEGRERARSALRLIEERGFHRGKDLLAEFDGLLPR